MPSEINPIGRLTVIKDGNVFGQTMDINLEEFTFGRDKDVDIRIVKDYVAPKALKLVCAGGKAYVINTSDKPGQIMVNKIEVPLCRKQVLRSGDIFSICERNFRFDYYDTYRPHEDEDSVTVLQTLDQCRTPPTNGSSTTPSSKSKDTVTTASSASKGRRSPRFSTGNNNDASTTYLTNMNDTSVLNQSMVKDQTIILKNSTKDNSLIHASSSSTVIRTPKAIRPVPITPSRTNNNNNGNNNSIDNNTSYVQLLGALNATNTTVIKPIPTPSAPKSIMKKSPNTSSSLSSSTPAPKAATEDIPTPVRNSIQTLRSAATPKLATTVTKKSPSTPVDSNLPPPSTSSAKKSTPPANGSSKRRSPSPSPLPSISNTDVITTPPPATIVPSSTTKSTTPASSSRKNTPTSGPMARGSPLSLMTAPTPLRAKALTTVKDHHHRTPAKSALKKSVIKMIQDENSMVIDDNSTGGNSIVPSFPTLSTSPPLTENTSPGNGNHRALPTPIRAFIHKKRKSITFGHSHAALIPPKEDNRHFLLDDDNRNSDAENKGKTDDDDETTKNTKLNSTSTVVNVAPKTAKVTSPTNANATLTSMNTMNNTFSMGIAPTNRSAFLDSINKRRKSYGSSLPPGKTLPPPEDTHLQNLPTTTTNDKTSPSNKGKGNSATQTVAPKFALPSPLRRQITGRRASESTATATSTGPSLADILTKVNENSKKSTANSATVSSTTTTLSSSTFSSSTKPTKSVVSLGSELAKALQARRAKIDPTATTEISTTSTAATRSSPRTVVPATKSRSPVITVTSLPTLSTTTTAAATGRKFTLPSPLTRQIQSRRKSTNNDQGAAMDTRSPPTVTVPKVPTPITRTTVSPQQASVSIATTTTVVRGLPTPLKRSIALRRKSMGTVITPGKAATHTKFIDAETEDKFSPLLPGQRMHMKFSDSGRIVSKTKVRDIVANEDDEMDDNVDNDDYEGDEEYDENAMNDGDEEEEEEETIPVPVLMSSRRKSVGPKNSHVIFTSPTGTVSSSNHLIFTSPTEKIGTPKSSSRASPSSSSTGKSTTLSSSVSKFTAGKASVTLTPTLSPLGTASSGSARKALPTPVRQAIQAKRKSLPSLVTLPTESSTPSSSGNPAVRKGLPTPLRTAINNKRKSYGSANITEDTVDDDDGYNEETMSSLTPIGKSATPKSIPKTGTPKTSSTTPVALLSSGKRSTPGPSVTPASVASSGKRSSSLSSIKSSRSQRSIPEVDNEDDDGEENTLNESLPVDDEEDEEDERIPGPWDNETDPRYHRGNRSIIYARSEARLSTVMESDNEEEEERLRLLQESMYEDEEDNYSGYNRRNTYQRNGGRSSTAGRRRQTGTPKRRSISTDISTTTPLVTSLSSSGSNSHVDDSSNVHPSSGRRTSIGKSTTPGSTTRIISSSTTPVTNENVTQKSTGKKGRKSVIAVTGTDETESETEISLTAATTKKGGKGKTNTIVTAEPVAITKVTRGTKRKEAESVEEPKPSKTAKRVTKKAKVVAVAEEEDGEDTDEEEEEETPCNVCGKLKPALVIGCDGPCNNWYHPKCVGLAKAPTDDDEWYCPTCTEAKETVGKKRSKTVVTVGKQETPMVPSLRIDDLADMKVAELRKAAETYGLDSGGTKTVLVDILTQFLRGSTKDGRKKKPVAKAAERTEEEEEEEEADAPVVGTKRGRTGKAKVIADSEPVANNRKTTRTGTVAVTSTTSTMNGTKTGAKGKGKK